MSGVTPLAVALARQVTGAETNDLPPAVSEAAMLRVLDTIAVAVAGAQTPPARAARLLALRGASNQGVSIWGTGRRAPEELAVLANATAAHALDYDDANYYAVMHAGALVVPVALAVGEQEASSGRAVLAAVVAGYQVGCYLGQLAFRAFQPRGFHSTSVLGIFAGATVAGLLRRLPEDTFVDAFGICGSMASGVMEFLKGGGDTKPLQVGWAARSALAAVALAEAGASGPSTVLEGEYGIFRSFAGKEVDSAVALPPLWDGYAICRAATKFYEVCGAIHGPADAWKQVLTQLEDEGLDAFDDLGSVVCALSGFAARLVWYPKERKRRPATAHEARFSLPWCLARLALDGHIGSQSFLDEALFESRGLALAQRVDCRLLEPDEEETTLAIVEATTRTGRTYRAEVGPSSREGGSPADVQDKVRRTLTDAGMAEAVGPLIAAGLALHDADSLRDLSGVIDRITCEGGR